jgi:hypothetical protein
MRQRSLNAALPVFLCLITLSGFTQNNPCNVMNLGPQASLNGFVPFPPDSLWNTNIANAPVDPNSDAIINYIGTSTPLHPDFGSGQYNGHSIGIPYAVVPGVQPLVFVNYNLFGSESDPGPMPIPLNAQIEGYPDPGNGDRHVLIIDKGTCWLYEMYGAYRLNPGLWVAGSGATWDLEANQTRPYTWTSADAAGLPIFPGLVRWDEVASGHINHAIRMTLQHSKQAFTPPASHWAANSSNQYAAPMGMRLRLKANVDISGYPPEDQVILTALKQYGAIMADNGSSLFITGTADNHWNNDNLLQMRSITAADFEIVQISPLYTPDNYPVGPNPTINSFTGTQSHGPGDPVTLSWNVTNGEYFALSLMGAIRGNSAAVSPARTTTYTLYATNQYGRTTAQYTVVVPQ